MQFNMVIFSAQFTVARCGYWLANHVLAVDDLIMDLGIKIAICAVTIVLVGSLTIVDPGVRMQIADYLTRYHK